jgi:hypothetical protein
VGARLAHKDLVLSIECKEIYFLFKTDVFHHKGQGKKDATRYLRHKTSKVLVKARVRS